MTSYTTDPVLMSVAIGGLLGITLLLIKSPIFAWTILLVTCILVPHTILYSSYVPKHFGITEGAPTINTYYLAIATSAVVLAARGFMKQFSIFLPLVAVLWIVGRFSWGNGLAVTSGAVLYTMAALAAAIGFATGRALQTGSDRLRSQFITVIAVISVIELFDSVYQKYGSDIGRADGTFNHPGTLGKFAYLFAVLALPFLNSKDTACRVSSFVSLFSLFGCIFVSEGRANYIAFGALIFLWIAVGWRGSSAILKAMALVSIAIAAALTVLPFANRFAEDPGGGQRDHFLEVALEQIPQRILLGTGPNRYIDIVGRIDQLTADGYPVHNVFLLIVGEIGLIGFAAFVIPLVVWIRWWWNARSSADLESRNFALAGLCSLPGFFVVAYTGWGLLQGTAMILWLTTWGVISGVASSVKVVESSGEVLDVIEISSDRSMR